MATSALIGCEDLVRTLSDEKQVVFDATFFLPRQQRDARAEYRRNHIPCAQFFDIDQIADPGNPLPHSLPNAEDFAAAVGELGIDNHTRVIVYDNNHFFAAARVWWMFRVFGHDDVRIVDGGLVRWRQLGLPVDSLDSPATNKRFIPTYRPELVCDLEGMRHIQQNACRQIIDARSPDSFFGQRPLKTPVLEPGHIPGSLNIPYESLTDQNLQTLLPNSQLQSLFSNAGVDLSKNIVTTCGSGVSAAVLALALYQLGQHCVPMYDGSWEEWGRQSDTPKIAVV